MPIWSRSKTATNCTTCSDPQATSPSTLRTRSTRTSLPRSTRTRSTIPSEPARAQTRPSTPPLAGKPILRWRPPLPTRTKPTGSEKQDILKSPKPLTCIRLTQYDHFITPSAAVLVPCSIRQFTYQYRALLLLTRRTTPSSAAVRVPINVLNNCISLYNSKNEKRVLNAITARSLFEVSLM